MSVAEMPRKARAIGLACAVALIVIAAIVFWSNRPPPVTAPSRAFFTVDDGTTWFTDSAEKLPPFEHEGKQAYRAHLFTCDGGKTKFVAYMERYSEAQKRQQEAARDGKPRPPEQITTFGPTTGLEVKRPGDKEWVARTDPRAAQLLSGIRCPDGSTANLQPVLP